MLKFFNWRRGPSNAVIDAELKQLDAQIRKAPAGHETTLLNRAGELCLEAGQTERALGYFGRAIGTYLEYGRTDAAEVLCRKMLRVAPKAVRTHCTLTWISLSRNHVDDARRAIAAYVKAARRAGQEKPAAAQLRMMAEVTENATLREQIGEHLLVLGDDSGANTVFGLIYAARNGLAPALRVDAADRWSRVLRAVAMSPESLHALSLEAA